MDRGVRYLSDRYWTYCERHEIEQLVDQTRNSYDNAAESVFPAIKHELPVNGVLESFEPMRTKWYGAIDRFYHLERWHSALGHLSPIEYEAQWLDNFSSGHASN